MYNTIYFDRLKAICKANNFARKGTAFFRVIGDGVLQVINYKKRRYAVNHHINIGLFSLYGEIEEQWLTSAGCIPRYSLFALFSPILEAIHCTTLGPPEDTQLEILEQKCIPWLNTILTQSILAEAMCMLDCASYSDITPSEISDFSGSISTTDYAWLILWDDSLKLAPYMKSGQYQKALQVVDAIRKQHRSAREDWKKQLSEQDYIKHIAKQDQIDKPFYDLFELIERQNQEEIHEYMENNYRTNCSLLRFAMRTNKESK